MSKGLPLLGPGGAMEISNSLTESAQKTANLALTQGKAGEAVLDTHGKQLDNFDSKVEPILTERDPAKQQQMISNLQSEIQTHPELYPVEATQHMDKMGTVQGLQAAANISKIRRDVIEDATKQVNLTKAQQEADPVLKLSTPEALAAPGAKAAIQAKIADPQTDPADIPRLKALLPKADVAQNQIINMKQRELQAQQAVTQGGAAGANALADMLVKRQITVDEMKVRGLTPQFEAQVFGLAAQKDPTWKAPEAAAQGAVAKSPQNQMFFGNTDSLLTKGGTLDQLSQAGKNLGNTQLPAWNSVQNLVKASLGKGPVAAYAAAILNVADDQAKVMGGTGAATDTSRQQSLDLYGRNMSPEAREAAIQQVRQGVLSQRRGRVGTNPYLQDMYPEPQQGGGAVPQSLTAAQITAYAKAHNVSEDEVKRQAKAQNIKVPD